MKKVVADREISYFFESEKEMRDFAKSIGLRITRYSKEKYKVDSKDSNYFYSAYNRKHIMTYKKNHKNSEFDWCKDNYELLLYIKYSLKGE